MLRVSAWSEWSAGCWKVVMRAGESEDQFRRAARAVTFVAAAATRLLSTSGCGAVWDADGKRHAFGIGYVSWPLAEGGGPMVVSGFDAAGAGIYATRAAAGVFFGYRRERVVTLGPNEFVTLECLDCDLATARARAGRIRQGEEP